MHIDLLRVTAANLPGILTELAHVYSGIWEEPPWNEEWDPAVVISDITNEMAHPHAEMVLAIADGKIVGFTWGYEVTPEMLTKIASSSSIDFIFRRGSRRFFYIDELGVSKAARRCNLGERLSRELLRLAKEEHGFDNFVLRTDRAATPACCLYQKLGFSELLVKDAQYQNRTYWVLDLAAPVRASTRGFGEDRPTLLPERGMLRIICLTHGHEIPIEDVPENTAHSELLDLAAPHRGAGIDLYTVDSAGRVVHSL